MVRRVTKKNTTHARRCPGRPDRPARGCIPSTAWTAALRSSPAHRGRTPGMRSGCFRWRAQRGQEAQELTRTVAGHGQVVSSHRHIGDLVRFRGGLHAAERAHGDDGAEHGHRCCYGRLPGQQGTKAGPFCAPGRRTFKQLLSSSPVPRDLLSSRSVWIY